jgi:hypothetical protein
VTRRIPRQQDHSRHGCVRADVEVLRSGPGLDGQSGDSLELAEAVSDHRETVRQSPSHWGRSASPVGPAPPDPGMHPRARQVDREKRETLQHRLHRGCAAGLHPRVQRPVETVQQLARGDHRDEEFLVRAPPQPLSQIQPPALVLDEHVGIDQDARGSRGSPLAISSRAAPSSSTACDRSSPSTPAANARSLHFHISDFAGSAHTGLGSSEAECRRLQVEVQALPNEERGATRKASEEVSRRSARRQAVVRGFPAGTT